MAFQSVVDYDEQKFGERFRLGNDGDYADVIILYQNERDMLLGDVHYLKDSTGEGGYVHCLGGGCPACGKDIRLQKKIFVPMYLIAEQKVVFWDRNISMKWQLQKDIFERYTDPSKVVFRIIRHGEYRSLDTTYEIKGEGNNNVMSYDEICSKFNIKFPDYYENICKSKSLGDMESMLLNGNGGVPNDVGYDATLPDYQVQPRAVVTSSSDYEGENASTPVVAPPSDIVNIPNSNDTEDVPF